MNHKYDNKLKFDLKVIQVHRGLNKYICIDKRVPLKIAPNTHK